MSDHHEPEIEEIIRTETRAGAREARVRLLDRRLILIYLFMVLIATEQIWFERASHSNCHSTAAIVSTFDSYLEKQIPLVEARKDLTPQVKQSLVANYRAHLLPVPHCTLLVVP
jgi:hypothetical protein